MRQGRLFLHLRDGKFENVEEMERAFNRNGAQTNAFSDINTEAQAPLGIVVTTIDNTISNVAKSVFKK